MFQTIIKTTRGKWAIALSIIAIAGVVSAISEGAIDRQAISGAVMLIIISAVLVFSAIKTINTPASVLWRKWADVPMNEAQLRRLERGIECEFTPKEINLDAKYAIIVGSESKAYKTTLTKCTCPDFKKRNLPCKHMYYLALQTEAIDFNGKVK